MKGLGFKLRADVDQVCARVDSSGCRVVDTEGLSLSQPL